MADPKVECAPPRGNRKHGHTVGPLRREWYVWRAMIRRCHEPRDKKFRLYGGAGITVCDRWRESFDAFIADMGPRPPNTTLERKRSADGYGPENCVWADYFVQNANTSRNVYVEMAGERVCLAEAARRTGLSPSVLHFRLRQGWPVERALSLPANGDFSSRVRKIEIDGQVMSMTRAAAKYGIGRATLDRRLAKGWSVEDALKTPPRW